MEDYGAFVRAFADHVRSLDGINTDAVETDFPDVASTEDIVAERERILSRIRECADRMAGELHRVEGSNYGTFDTRVGRSRWELKWGGRPGAVPPGRRRRRCLPALPVRTAFAEGPAPPRRGRRRLRRGVQRPRPGDIRGTLDRLAVALARATPLGSEIMVGRTHEYPLPAAHFVPRTCETGEYVLWLRWWSRPRG